MKRKFINFDFLSDEFFSFPDSLFFFLPLSLRGEKL